MHQCERFLRLSPHVGNFPSLLAIKLSQADKLVSAIQEKKMKIEKKEFFKIKK